MYSISSVFNEVDKSTGITNKGVDIVVPHLRILRSFASGVVEGVSDHSLKIKLMDGYHVIYNHLSQVFVKVGEHVTAQYMLGKTGMKDNSILHVGIINPNGHFIDPSRYIMLDQIQNPTVIYGVSNWSDHLVSGWFDQMGESISHGLQNSAVGIFHAIDSGMPELVVTLLVAASFLKMVGSKVWSPRLYLVGGIGVLWIVMF